MRSSLYFVRISFLYFLLGTSVYANPETPSATIDTGVIIGTTTSLPAASTPINKFLGIPFAAPPKRFSPPEKPQQWPQLLDTKTYKPACIQQFSYPEESRSVAKAAYNTPAPEESEDCLYLNVYAPASPGKGRAVLFWIYGGALQFGHAAHPTYGGSHLANEDVIVVTSNYRTNVFGFPSSPELPTQQRNLGFLDQRLALDWVQRNIEAFGGDPNKVTLFGESAGAFSIDAHLTAPYPKGTKPPFRAAILQSGQISYRGNPSPGRPYPDSIDAWNSLATALNCTGKPSSLKCIEQVPAATIRDIIERKSLGFWPAFDNVTLVKNPAQARISGNIARIPILSGTLADEGRILALGYRDNGDVASYLKSIIGDEPVEIREAIESAYPVGGSEFPTTYDAVARMETDVSFQCGAALVANDTAAAGIPSWRYYYNASFSNIEAIPGARLGAYHSSELAIVFGTYPRANVTTQENAFSNYLRMVWAQFAKNPEAGPGWNAVGTGSEYLDGAGDLDLGILGGDGGAGAKVIRQSEVDFRCDLWRPIITREV